MPKSILLFIQSRYTQLSGNWKWDLHSDAVFCSDVILSSPTHFDGTTSIIHPDDLKTVKAGLTALESNHSIDLQFRIITTYGSIKALEGTEVSIASAEKENEIIPYPESNLLEEEKMRIQVRKEKAYWHLKNESSIQAERLSETGTWFINSATGETVFSDQVFRIYGLQPQSLNMHPHTFNNFIHFEDQQVVLETFEKAYEERLPLDIEFRIIRADGKERQVKHILHWSFSADGAQMLHGTLRDITEQKEQEQLVEQADDRSQFLNTILKMLEQDSNSAYWYTHLVTRKTVFSDNIFRILGLKPHSVPSDFTHLLKYVQLVDQELLENTLHKARINHSPFEIEYRIVRPDGKIRNVKQTGKLEIFAQSELVLIGTLKDITQQKSLEEKLNLYTQQNEIQAFIQENLEESSLAGSFIWDLETDNISWSKNLYKVLGVKLSNIQPTPKFIHKFIHPIDLEIYKGELSSVLQGQDREEFQIRIIARIETRQLKVKLHLVQHEGNNFLIGVFIDITEKISLEEEALEQIRVAEQLTENLPDRIMITDSNYNIITWNKACEEKYIRKKDDVEGLNYFDVFPEQKTTDTISNFSEALSGNPVHLYLQPTLQKGFDNWHMLPLKGTGDNIIGILHILQDVTADHKLKQQLNERLRLMESLVDATVERIIALDRNMNYLYWNKKSEEYYGLNKEQVVGRNILEVFPGFINDPSYNEFKRATRGETVHITGSELSENGNNYTYETYLIPVKGEEDQVLAVLWITHPPVPREQLVMGKDSMSNDQLATVNGQS